MHFRSNLQNITNRFLNILFLFHQIFRTSSKQFSLIEFRLLAFKNVAQNRAILASHWEHYEKLTYISNYTCFVYFVMPVMHWQTFLINFKIFTKAMSMSMFKFHSGSWPLVTYIFAIFILETSVFFRGNYFQNWWDQWESKIKNYPKECRKNYFFENRCNFLLQTFRKCQKLKKNTIMNW